MKGLLSRLDRLERAIVPAADPGRIVFVDRTRGMSDEEAAEQLRRAREQAGRAGWVIEVVEEGMQRMTNPPADIRIGGIRNDDI
jgi:hypothetical protein